MDYVKLPSPKYSMSHPRFQGSFKLLQEILLQGSLCGRTGSIFHQFQPTMWTHNIFPFRLTKLAQCLERLYSTL